MFDLAPSPNSPCSPRRGRRGAVATSSSGPAPAALRLATRRRRVTCAAARAHSSLERRVLTCSKEIFGPDSADQTTTRSPLRRCSGRRRSARADTKAKISATKSKPGAKRIYCPGACGYSVNAANGSFMRVHFGLEPLPVASRRCVPVKKNADGEPCNGLQVARNAVAAGYALAIPATFTRAGDLKTGADRLKHFKGCSRRGPPGPSPSLVGMPRGRFGRPKLHSQSRRYTRRPLPPSSSSSRTHGRALPARLFAGHAAR